MSAKELFKSKRFKNTVLIVAALGWPFWLVLASGYPYKVQGEVYCDPSEANNAFNKLFLLLAIIFITLPSVFCIWKTSFKLDAKAAILTGYILIGLPLAYVLFVYMMLEYGAQCY